MFSISRPPVLTTDTISEHGKKARKRDKYYYDEEAAELSPLKSVALQSSETQKWNRVLIKRAGNRLGMARAAHHRNVRTARMSKMRDAIRNNYNGTNSSQDESECDVLSGNSHTNMVSTQLPSSVEIKLEGDVDIDDDVSGTQSDSANTTESDSDNTPFSIRFRAEMNYRRKHDMQDQESEGIEASDSESDASSNGGSGSSNGKDTSSDEYEQESEEQSLASDEAEEESCYHSKHSVATQQLRCKVTIKK